MIILIGQKAVDRYENRLLVENKRLYGLLKDAAFFQRAVEELISKEFVLEILNKQAEIRADTLRGFMR